jgi:hypothetical protein
MKAEMKGTLKVFFAGFGAGLLVTFLLVGFALDIPETPRHATPGFVYLSSTNAALAWKQMNGTN